MRRSVKIFVGVLVVLVAIRVLLPFIGLVTINHLLKNKLGNYTGHIEDFDLSLWRGAYQVQGFEIKKNNSNLPPLISAKEIDLSIVWASLFKKEISGDIILLEPNINLTDSTKKEEQQTGTEESKEAWQSVFETIIPIHIESLIVTNGQIQFLNYNLKDPIPVKLDKVSVSAMNLRSDESGLASPFKVTARAQDHAELYAGGKINIMVSPPQGDFDFSFENFHLNSINANLRSYIPLDVTKGDLSVYGELASRDKNAIGYVKIFYKDGDIIAPKQAYKGIKHFFIEIAAAFSNWLLKNKDSKSIALELPIEVKNGEFNISAADAFWSMVENRKDEIKPGIDKKISFSNLSGAKK